MRSFRLLALLLVLLGVSVVFYYHSKQAVHTETVQFTSKLTGKTLPYEVVLPPNYGLITSRRKRYPVVYLLHGWSGRFDSWLTNTNLTRYAAEHQLIIVTPEGGNGWYTDSVTNPSEKYESYIVNELIPDVDSRYRTIRDRRGRGMAGNSMGGYGALKFGFKHPELFKLVASMSGALDVTARNDDTSIVQTFGEPGSSVRFDNDVQRLARDFPADQVSKLPYVYLDCGLDDPWLASNNQFSNILVERKMVHEYRQVPGGHVWPYWDKQIVEVLRVASDNLAPPE